MKSLGVCLAAAVLGALTGAVPATPAAETHRDFLIVLDGTFSEFVMYCDLVDGDSRRTIRRREFLPQEYRLTADAVSCTVTMLDFRGRISAALYRGDQLIASARQNAIRPIVKVRSDGPWGAARGARSAVPIRPQEGR